MTPTDGVKIAILDDYQGVALDMADWSLLSPKADITVFRDHLTDLDALADRLLPFEIICPMRERTPFPRTLIDRLPNLRLIATSGRSNVAIDLQAAADRNVIVSGTDVSGYSTPELTWGLILSLVKNIPAEANSVRSGGWQIALGCDLRGQTLGILGLGRIGRLVAKVGAAFGMRLIAWSENLTAEIAGAHDARLVDKDELFRQSDILTIHSVLSKRTRDLVGAHELGLMKPSAYLINTSRGPIVTEDALIAALRAGTIAGAALDVFAEEPLPSDHPFRSLRNVLTTPHVGYVSVNTYRVFYGQTVENIVAFLSGAPTNVIEPAFQQKRYS